MRAKIEGQIEEQIGQWQQGLEGLQAQRTRLANALAETDAALLRNQGAIQGAQELLARLFPAEPEGETADAQENTPDA